MWMYGLSFPRKAPYISPPSHPPPSISNTEWIVILLHSNESRSFQLYSFTIWNVQRDWGEADPYVTNFRQKSGLINCATIDSFLNVTNRYDFRILLLLSLQMKKRILTGPGKMPASKHKVWNRINVISNGFGPNCSNIHYFLGISKWPPHPTNGRKCLEDLGVCVTRQKI